MKIFALNLCLEFCVKEAQKIEHKDTITFSELMGKFFKGDSMEGNHFYLDASRGDWAMEDLIDLQQNNIWREMDTHLSILFPNAQKKEEFIEAFKDRFSIAEAAGGLVENEKSQYLFIYHRERWSLPKGHIEWQESPEHAAVREVKEETGIQQVRLGPPLLKTYHTFKRSRKWIFKITHWYKMQADSSERLIPQEEEDITAIEWKDKQSWDSIKNESYPQIRQILSQAMKEKAI